MATNTLPNGYLLDDRYEIVSVLGQGGFGITYLAKSIKLEHQVVIKEFLPQNMAVRDQSHYTVTPYSQGDSLYSHLLKRFVEEARLLANLRHPNIVKVADFLEANETAYFIMDYEEGETLEDYLQEHSTLTEQDILSIMMPILEGTKYVHSKGVLHRDIAPDNIYLKTNGMPMLIDFGAARNAIAQQSQVLSAIAKDGYSPPEQYTPNTEQNASTDIYALGAVMYRMVTGNKPANAAQRQMALLNNELDPTGDIVEGYKTKYSKTLLQAIVKAIAIRQNDRFQSIEEFQRAISEGIIIEPPIYPQPEKKGKTGLIIGLLVAILIVGGAIGYLVLQPKSDTIYTPVDTTDINSQSNSNEISKIKADKAKQEEVEKAQAEEIRIAKQKEEEAKAKRLAEEQESQAQIQRQKNELDRLNREMEAKKVQAQIEQNRRELAEMERQKAVAKAEQERLEREREQARIEAENTPKVLTESFSENGIDIVVNYPSFVKAGESFELTAEMTNNNSRAKQGGLTLSFPDMSSMSGSALGNSFSRVNSYSYPQKIYNKQKRRAIPADYFMVEGWQETSWGNGRTKYFKVELRAPSSLSEFRVYVRGVLWIRSKHDIRVIPASSYSTDQQGFGVRELNIKVK